MNIQINTINTLIEKVWDQRTIQIFRLINNLGFNNEIDFDILKLSDWWLNKFRAKLSQEWIVKKWRLSEKTWYKWYLNPLYFNRWKIDESLYLLFDKENQWKIY
jgi:hypothetical protein